MNCHIKSVFFFLLCQSPVTLSVYSAIVIHCRVTRFLMVEYGTDGQGVGNMTTICENLFHDIYIIFKYIYIERERGREGERERFCYIKKNKKANYKP